MAIEVERLEGPHLRERELLTQARLRDVKHLALVIGVPYSTVWSYFSGRTRRYDAEVIAKIADCLEVSEKDVRSLLAELRASIGCWTYILSDQRACGLTRASDYVFIPRLNVRESAA